MYPSPYSSTTLSDVVSSADEELEARVQAVLTGLEGLPEDVQVAVYTRLLSGLTKKLTGAFITKAIAAAKAEAAPAKSKASAARNQTGARRAGNNDVPRADSLLRQLHDPTDPVEAWQRFGGSAAQMFDVLREEPAGLLNSMLSHRNMPPGTKPKSKAREKLAEAIAVRMEQHYVGR